MFGLKKASAGAKFRRETGETEVIAVAIDRDRSSQTALKWALDHLWQKRQTIYLVHVKVQSSLNKGEGNLLSIDTETPSRVFLPFRCYCTRRNIDCNDVLLEGTDVAKALTEYVSAAGIEVLVVGYSSKNGFLRFNKPIDIPGSLLKTVPDFCNVYVIYKGKISTARSAARSAPSSPVRAQPHQPSSKPPQPARAVFQANNFRGSERSSFESQRRSLDDPSDYIRSPFDRNGVGSVKSFGEISASETDISFINSERPSLDRLIPSYYQNSDPSHTPSRLSNLSDFDYYTSNDNSPFGRRSLDSGSPICGSSYTTENEVISSGSQGVDDMEEEMRRLKMELRQTFEMYTSACREALTAKQKAKEIQQWKLEEGRRLEQARMAEETAISLAEKEKEKSRAAQEAAEAAQKVAELEAQKRISAEKKALKTFSNTDFRYRRYSIDEIEKATEFFTEKFKIGEGGYGPVYKCFLDHTEVAVKVLRPGAAQGRSQFQQEVEILSCIRHPNMVLLLGACPEYGCLVYEFMANGSLEDCLFRKGNRPPLSWQSRFRIAAEIGTALLFLHQAKPEPLVHRDLKPANILLDRNLVSKIADVGLARLVPPSVADAVTQYIMTTAAGTFCYIDPEYQQTGMLGVKSDIYPLGIMFLQLLTAKPPMGLAHHVERAIKKGSLAGLLDPAVPNWPVEEAMELAELSLKCAELRRKDRPDLAKDVLPVLDKLRLLADESLQAVDVINPGPTPNPSQDFM